VQQDPGLTGEERAELERLRAEVARLRAAAPVGAPERPPARPPGSGRWRAVMAGLLVAVGCVLVPLSAVAVWTRNQVTDTNRYVATVSPWPATRPSRRPWPTKSPPRSSATSTSRA
jgi:hypothetical protein